MVRTENPNRDPEPLTLCVSQKTFPKLRDPRAETSQGVYSAVSSPETVCLVLSSWDRVQDRTRSLIWHVAKLVSLLHEPLSQYHTACVLLPTITRDTANQLHPRWRNSHIAKQFPKNTEKQPLQTVGQESSGQSPPKQRQDPFGSHNLLCGSP
jgi:hypothetical protein